MFARTSTAQLRRWIGLLVAAMWLVGLFLAAAVVEREAVREARAETEESGG